MKNLSGSRYVGYQGIYPIVEYARKIGKNTAEFTTIDMVNFTRWWMKQPQRGELLEATAEQRKIYHQDVAAMKQWREDQKMGKNTQKTKDAATSRLPKGMTDKERMIEEDLQDGEVVDMDEVVEEASAEVVCTMELTKQDVEALLFSISRTFEDYEMEEDHPHTISLLSLKEGLEGV
jgi:hypothetical protein